MAVIKLTKSLCWAVPFSFSAHVRLRHYDVIKFSLCILIFQKAETAPKIHQNNWKWVEMNSEMFLKSFEVPYDQILQNWKIRNYMGRLWR